VDLVQLRPFVQVADLGSLSKAATRLRIAQPALSRQIRLLEEELGLQLFDRHGRGMVITERGRQLPRHASTVLAGIEDLRAEAGEQSMALTGRVAIGMPPTVGDIPVCAAGRGPAQRTS
jgi:LysR family nitrogen assimilation transcriptional regulator